MPSNATEELVQALFGGTGRPLAGWFAALLDGSAPFRAFAEANRSKIRKKHRLSRDSESLRDLQCELAVAALLAGDRSSPLSYEPLAASGGRGPDFGLSFKGHTQVYCEVTRVRRLQPVRVAGEPHLRLAALLCGKLRQLPGGASGILLVVADGEPYDEAVCAQAMQLLRERAAAGDDAFFAFRGLEGVRDFHRYLPRLSAIILIVPPHLESPGANRLWLHPLARHPLPPDLLNRIRGWDFAALLKLPG